MSKTAVQYTRSRALGSKPAAQRTRSLALGSKPAAQCTRSLALGDKPAAQCARSLALGGSSPQPRAGQQARSTAYAPPRAGGPSPQHSVHAASRRGWVGGASPPLYNMHEAMGRERASMPQLHPPSQCRPPHTAAGYVAQPVTAPPTTHIRASDEHGIRAEPSSSCGGRRRTGRQPPAQGKQPAPTGPPGLPAYPHTAGRTTRPQLFHRAW